MSQPYHDDPVAPRKLSAAALAELLDFSPDALIVTDQAGTLLLVNEQTAALFGYERTELVGQALELLLPERLRAAHVIHRQHFFAQPRARPMGAHLDLVARRKDGSEFPVDISLRPVLLDATLLTIGALRDLSERKRIERERLQQAEQIRTQAELLDLAHDAILVRDPADRVTFWNKGAEALYGWPTQEALGHVAHTLLQTRFPASKLALQAQIEQDGFWEGELVHMCRDGRQVVVESRQVLTRDAQGCPTSILEINRDITRRRQLEQQAQAAYTATLAHLTFLQQLIDTLPSSVYLVYGPDARLGLANRAAASLWGATWQIDQPLEAFLTTTGISVSTADGHPLALEDFATLRAVRGGETVFGQQETIRRPDGSRLAVQVNALPLDVPVGWTVFRDQTVGEDAAPAPAQAVALVVHQDVSALKEAEALKDEFIAIAAHELRNPLGALKGFADMLLYQTARGKGPELAVWQQEALDEIGQATRRLERLTENLLDVTRLQGGRLALSRAPTDLVALVWHLLAQAQMSTQQHTLSFQTPHATLLVEIDRMRIEQVLSNLLSNAVKYSPQGGPIEVTLQEDSASRTVQLSVRDRGIGIPASQQARIFGRFVRGENAQAAQIGGTGLGLYLSRELVELHGGHLWFESTEGAGSTFFLTLPLP